MRVYLPASASDLASTTGLAASPGHAVTPGLRRALPDEDDDGLEMSAFLAAADASVALIAERGDVPRRVVVAADVPRAGSQPGGLPTQVGAPGVTWDAVVSIHVDEPEAAADVAAAARGDDEAFERAAERDLLWFDASERQDVLNDLLG